MSLELEGLRWDPEPTETSTARLDLVLELQQDRQGMTGTLTYDQDLFDRSTVERLAGHYRSLLASAASR